MKLIDCRKIPISEIKQFGVSGRILNLFMNNYE